MGIFGDAWKGVKSVGKAAGTFGGHVLRATPGIGGIVDPFFTGKEKEKAAQQETALQKYLTDLPIQQAEKQLGLERDIAAGKALGEQQAQQRAIQAYQQAKMGLAGMSGTPAAITNLQRLINLGQTPEQQRGLAQANLSLQQAGVRGPEAELRQQISAASLKQGLLEEVAKLRDQQKLKEIEDARQVKAQQAMDAYAKMLQPTISATRKLGNEPFIGGR
jgi:hypothetical protein